MMDEMLIIVWYLHPDFRVTTRFYCVGAREIVESAVTETTDEGSLEWRSSTEITYM